MEAHVTYHLSVNESGSFWRLIKKTTQHTTQALAKTSPWRLVHMEKFEFRQITCKHQKFYT